MPIEIKVLLNGKDVDRKITHQPLDYGAAEFIFRTCRDTADNWQAAILDRRIIAAKMGFILHVSAGKASD